MGRGILRIFSVALVSVSIIACTSGRSGNGDSGSTLLEVLPAQVFAKINIVTDGGVPVDSKDVYVNGTVMVEPNGVDPTWAYTGAMKIKGRGNSTWSMPKKPFKIKLNAANPMLGMPSDKEWVLLANYSDKTLMRNEIAFETGRRIGMAYVPRSRTVEVTLNGTELGTYLLTEQVKVAPNRVDAVATDVTGGYLLELDRRLDGTYFTTTRSVPYVIKEPSTLTADQTTYISTYVQQAEDALNSADFADPLTGYANYIDVDSFVDWFIVSEISKNVDAANFSSIYFYKSSGGKLVMGPLWDFDLGFGNCDYADAEFPTGWYIRTGSPWFSRLFQDPAFSQKVKQRWNQLKSKSADLNGIMRMVDRNAYAFDLLQQKNFTLWDILNVYVWPNRIVTGSYSGEVDAMKAWITERMTWMDNQLNP